MQSSHMALKSQDSGRELNKKEEKCFEQESFPDWIKTYCTYYLLIKYSKIISVQTLHFDTHLSIFFHFKNGTTLFYLHKHCVFVSVAQLSRIIN